MTKDIGILGASGLVGKETLFALKKKGYTLLIGARNIQNLEYVKKELCMDIEIMQVDVFIPKQVEEFCKQCRIVVNCTAPASAIGTRIIKECVKLGIDYIDPFREGEIERYVAENNESIQEKKNRIILSAGTYPGLSEILFKYVAEQYGNENLSVKEYFYGNGYFSYGATCDVLSSMLSGKAKSMSCVRRGKIVPYTMEFGESIVIDNEIGRIYPYPIISKEFYEVCKNAKVKEGCFFNTFTDMNSMATFFEIGSQIYHSDKAVAYDFADELKALYDGKKIGNEKTVFLFWIGDMAKTVAEGKKIVFEYLCNWNALSGYICGLTAEWCLEKRISKTGVYRIHELENIDKFVERIPCKVKKLK